LSLPIPAELRRRSILLELLLVSLELLDLLPELLDLLLELLLASLELLPRKLWILLPSTLVVVLLFVRSLLGTTAPLVELLPLLTATRCAARRASLLALSSLPALRLPVRGDGSCEYRQCDGCDSCIHCPTSCWLIPHLRI